MVEVDLSVLVAAIAVMIAAVVLLMPKKSAVEKVKNYPCACLVSTSQSTSMH
jgi:hypothetical protein